MPNLVLFLRKHQDLLLFIGRIFIGFIFMYAGFTKLTEPIENFRGAIAEYEVFPEVLVGLIALVLPWIEFIFGIFIILGYAPRLSALVLGGMSLSFAVLLLATGVFSEEGSKSCGCFGQDGLIKLTVRQVFFLDCFNFFLGLKLLFTKRHLWSLDQKLR